jgi:hypothetical protein
MGYVISFLIVAFMLLLFLENVRRIFRKSKYKQETVSWLSRHFHRMNLEYKEYGKYVDMVGDVHDNCDHLLYIYSELKKLGAAPKYKKRSKQVQRAS